ncbi:hypothetical protein RHS01_02927 [Rhizoctonia solani]|uniref:Uncharacterized protein n=1 Tax=Rhizoctonia solani TaxID=456999 RepID=A0A8H7IJU8_9AGAM|nr:hypothetical protein RHS01_02927 [Rhizoctonia solani]
MTATDGQNQALHQQLAHPHSPAAQVLPQVLLLTGVAGTIASSTAPSSNTGNATPTTATSGPGTSVEALQHIIQRRLQVLTMLKSSHEGAKHSNNEPPTASDFLRSLLGTLSEFDQFVGSGAEKAGLGMMMGWWMLRRARKMRNLFRANKVVRRPGAAGNSELAANDSSSDHSYLLFPSLVSLELIYPIERQVDLVLAHLLGTNPSATATAPFAFLPHPSPPPDASAGPMYSNAPGICGLGRDPGMVGAGLGQMVGSAGNQGDTIQWTPSLLEMVVKIDAKVKKTLSILLKELDAIARDSIRDELASLDPLALLRNATSPRVG